jgi:hypothetical protein
VLKLLIALPLAAAMLLTVRWCWKGDTWGLATLLLLCIVWLRVDKAFEGPHVFHLTRNHGLVLSDLFAVIVVAFGALAWLRRRRPFDRADSRRSSFRDQTAVGDREQTQIEGK